MAYTLPTKGRSVKRIELPLKINPGVGEQTLAAFGVVKLLEELNAIKNDITKSNEEKVKEVDGKIREIEEALRVATDTTETIKQAILDIKDEAIAIIKGIEAPPGKDGIDGKDAPLVDEEKIIQSVLARMPKPAQVDEKALIRKTLKALPENKASLKIIQERIEFDPMSVIEKIMALPADKFKLKRENIDGLEQTIQAFRSQLAKGYLHGGGDTIVAGSGITVTSNANGTKTIAASGLMTVAVYDPAGIAQQLLGTTATQTFSNKRRTRRVVTVTQSATPTFNTDNADEISITGLAQAITSMTTNLTGTPVAGDLLAVEITDNGTARAITWGASFVNGGLYNLPTTTVVSTKLVTFLKWNGSAWACMGTG